MEKMLTNSDIILELAERALGQDIESCQILEETNVLVGRFGPICYAYVMDDSLDYLEDFTGRAEITRVCRGFLLTRNYEEFPY